VLPGLKGLVELTIDPGFAGASVTVAVDGETIAERLHSPYRVTVDFGQRAIEHRISVTASAPDGKRVRWHETINQGLLPLQVKLRLLDAETGTFEAVTTAPEGDPIAAVELWEGGAAVARAESAPYRLTATPEQMRRGFVQVTARTRSGEEAADFWSASGEVHAESLDVRTVPIYVSVVDRNGNTLDDVDRSLFRILDNDSEGKIVEFGRAFDQPIAIALLVDASASMLGSMRDATRAAAGFVERTLKPGDRCAVFSIRSTPRRELPITDDLAAVARSLTSIEPQGQTSLYDALQTAIRELKDEKRRRAIVALTDGGDTSSISTYEEIEKSAREAGIPLYFIAFNSLDRNAERDLDRLRYLASETGGFVATASEQNLVSQYREIEKDLRAQFAILYQVTDFAKRNEWRRVRVVLRSPKLIARTIRGYYAP
jgi:VWFA-related protein